jgi:hypothetical protein
VHLEIAVLVLSVVSTMGAAVPYPSSNAATRRKPISLSHLHRGDTLRIEYSSSGCFSSTRAEVWILGRDPSVARVVVWDSGPVRVESPAEPKHRTVRLTSEDRRGLDKLIAFYRSSRSSGCTTVDHIKLTLSSKGQAVRSESFVDGSCRVHDEPGVVTLDEIVRLRT